MLQKKTRNNSKWGKTQDQIFILNFRNMELNGFYNEETLEELLFDGKITRLEFIYHHSQERIDDFKKYCQKRQLQENEAAAEAYTDFLLKKEETEHVNELD